MKSVSYWKSHASGGQPAKIGNIFQAIIDE